MKTTSNGPAAPARYDATDAARTSMLGSGRSGCRTAERAAAVSAAALRRQTCAAAGLFSTSAAAAAPRLAAAAAERDRSELVRAELQTQRARALGLQGRIEEGEALLDSLEPAFGVLELRVLLERGRLRAAAGDPVGATPLLEAALRAAR